MMPLSRRGVLLIGVAVPVAAQPPPTAWQFFSEDQARLVAAMVERLIPADDAHPGAIAAGVPNYIDRQLAGAHGAGARLFRQGPHKPGLPQQGYQLPHTPAELYRAGLAAMAEHVRTAYGRPFEDLDPRLQDDILGRVETGETVFEAIPSAVFFETLLANTIEGFFCDPIHGGNRDMAGWRMLGFPGGYAGYTELVGRHNLDLRQEPRGIAENMARPHGPGHHR